LDVSPVTFGRGTCPPYAVASKFVGSKLDAELAAWEISGGALGDVLAASSSQTGGGNSGASRQSFGSDLPVLFSIPLSISLQTTRSYAIGVRFSLSLASKQMSSGCHLSGFGGRDNGPVGSIGSKSKPRLVRHSAIRSATHSILVTFIRDGHLSEGDDFCRHD
jgi:hypothetical protein